MRNFAVEEKVIWVIATAHKNREGIQSVEDGLDGIWLGPGKGRGRAEEGNTFRRPKHSGWAIKRSLQTSCINNISHAGQSRKI